MLTKILPKAEALAQIYSLAQEFHQTVHRRLAKGNIQTLLRTTEEIGFGEIDRFKTAVDPDGRKLSLHSLIHRLGFNVNCIGIFGPDLDHSAMRVLLQNFTESQSELF